MKTLTTTTMKTIAGYRVMDTEPTVGTSLRNSFVWDGDEITDVELPGTCAFSSLAAARKYGRWSRGFWIVALTGEVVQSGDLPGEVIVRDAVIAQIVEII